MAISRLVPPVFVLIARDLLPRTTGDGPGLGEAGIPVFGIGLAVAPAFVFSDSAFVLFGVAVASLAIADVWLCRSFDPGRRAGCSTVCSS